MRRRTHEEFIKLVSDLTNDEYSVLGTYINNFTKITMSHNLCKYIWDVVPSSFIFGTRCPKCSGVLQKTHNQFIEEVYSLVKDEYTIIGTYINAKTKLIIQHNICGNLLDITPHGFLTGSRCSRCSGVAHKTTEEFIEEVFNLVGEEYTIVGKYINAKKKIKIRHNICNHIWNTEPTNFLSGKRCPRCSVITQADQKRKSHKIFVKEIYDLVGDEYDVLGEYMGSFTNILIRHNTCNNTYEVTPHSFLTGTRCPKCKSLSSKGEKIIKRILDQLNIYFIPQKHFNGCRNKHTLIFDIYLPKENICIEYQGIQHFEPIDFSGRGEKWAKQQLKESKKRDGIKKNFCKLNNIELLEIPYWENNNIELILIEKLIKKDG